MDKKMIAALIACIAGFAVFITLAVKVAVGGSRENGAVTNGRRIQYATVTYNQTDGTADNVSQDGSVKAPPASDSTFVRVTDYAPHIRVELRYATKGNLTGRQLYDFKDAWLRYGTVKKLIAAQEKLEKNGMGLAIWDAFRPEQAQRKLWEVCPNPLYVTDPDKGYSDHTRGNAVDVTLVDPDGTELLMPTGFDNLTKLADRDYSDIDDAFARENVEILEKVMKECGFKAYQEEWWHFTDTVEYEVSTEFLPES